jgi:hypothetical protein
MQNYGSIERMFAKTLEAFPRLKYIGKNIYQYINFFIFKENDFKYYIHPDAKLLTPYDWAGVDFKQESIFFGYYDKTPWNQLGNKLIYQRDKNTDTLEILVFEKKVNSVKTVATTRAWNYQQGAMLQWLDNKNIIFNDCVDHLLVSRIINIENGEEKRIDYPIQSIDSFGKEALTLNYKRLYKIRKQYGYKVSVLNFSEEMPLSEDGIWKVYLSTNKSELIISLDFLISNEHRKEMDSSEHKINHIIYSPKKTKFMFMHRWIGPNGKYSRLYVANKDGSNLRIIFDDRMVSHYSWRDENTIVAWARTKSKGDQYYLVKLDTMTYHALGENQLNLFGDGHPSFAPNGKWVITDTYPNRARQRYLLLFNTENNEIITLGRFYSPFKYNWDNRVDLHPRWNEMGNMISIDSCHEGVRKSYIIDVHSIVK